MKEWFCVWSEWVRKKKEVCAADKSWHGQS